MVPTAPTAGVGSTVTGRQLLPLTPQALDAVTQTVPEVLAKVTVMPFVPDPEVMDAPVGIVQLYVVVLGTVATE